jgi:hypothetical protein
MSTDSIDVFGPCDGSSGHGAVRSDRCARVNDLLHHQGAEVLVLCEDKLARMAANALRISGCNNDSLLRN